jgi:hypothetical protein
VNSYPDPSIHPSIHLIRIRKLPKLMRIRIRNPGLHKNNLSNVRYRTMYGTGRIWIRIHELQKRIWPLEVHNVLKELSLWLSKLVFRLGLDGEKAELSGSAEQSQRAASPDAASRLILHSESTQCFSYPTFERGQTLSVHDGHMLHLSWSAKVVCKMPFPIQLILSSS